VAGLAGVRGGLRRDGTGDCGNRLSRRASRPSHGKGARSFYEGPLAARIVRELRAWGVPIREADLAATRTRLEAPLAMAYRGLELLAPPPPTQGVTTLAIMGILERMAPRAEEGSVDFYHSVVEAVKQAFLDRGEIGDPDMGPQPVERWLDDARLGAKAAAIRPDRALEWPRVHRGSDTVFLAAVDAAGRSASVLQSLYFDWGSGIIAGDTGILWQNRGAAFSQAGGNRFRPGARPFYTLNPGIALRGGEPHLLYGTQGADGQPQTLALLLARAIDHGMAPDAALAAPRFLLGRTFSDTADSLKIEEAAGETVLAGLLGRQHEVKRLPALSPIFGQAGMISIGRGVVLGAHDPRSDGAALAETPDCD
jgi:oxamate amidohydrolase